MARVYLHMHLCVIFSWNVRDKQNIMIVERDIYSNQAMKRVKSKVYHKRAVDMNDI